MNKIICGRFKIKSIIIAGIILVVLIKLISSCGCDGDDDNYYEPPDFYVEIKEYYGPGGDKKNVGIYGEDVKISQVVSDLSKPVHNHYEFLGCYDSGNQQVITENWTSNFVFNENVFLTARWRGKEYKITLNPGLGELSLGDSEILARYGSTLTYLPIPTYDGYDFVGWSVTTDEEGLISAGDVLLTGKEVFNENNYPFVKNATTGEYTVSLQAIYVLAKRTITIDYNDGSYRSETIEILHGQTLEEAGIELPQDDDGSKFILGFSTVSVSLVEFEGPVVSDITLYAIWKEYKIFTFYNCYEIDPENITTVRVIRGDTAYVLTAPENVNGCEFNGWFTSRLYSGSRITSVSYNSSSTVYYAFMTPITYTITFETNGGSAVLADIAYTILDTIDLKSAGTKEYSLFDAWHKNEDLSDEGILKIEKGTYGNLTLYASWHGEHFTIKLNGNGGVIAKETDSIEYGKRFTLNIPIYSGYAFLGWYSQIEGGQQITDKTGYSLEPWTIASNDTIFYAQYLKKYFVTVSFSHQNAGSVKVEDYYVAGDEISLRIDISDSGFAIDGFYLNNTKVASGLYDFTIGENDVALEVRFKPAIFTISLDSQEGYCKDETVEVEYMSVYNLAIPYKEGYVFDGWYDGEVKITDNNGAGLKQWDTKSDVSLTAKYIEDPNASDKIFVRNADTLLSMKDAPSKTYILLANINMAGRAWVPFNFSGILEGNGYTISNISISSSSGNLGVFLTMSGIVKNVSFTGLIISSTDYNRVFVGGVCAENSGTISGVVVDGLITGDRVLMGGITGLLKQGTITNCVNYATVKTEGIETNTAIGGIAGQVDGGSMNKCVNYGTITGKDKTGGIIGYTSQRNFAELTNYGVVTGRDYVGGIIAHFTSGGSYEITIMTNNGSVSGRNSVGGIFGNFTNQVYDGTSFKMTKLTNAGNINGVERVGGICGYLYADANRSGHTLTLTATIFKNTGNVTGTTKVGGLIGEGISDITNSSISFSESKGNIAGEAYVGGLAGRLSLIRLVECSNEGSFVTASGFIDGNAYLGGYAGESYIVEGCHNAVEITYTSTGNYIGGISGYSSGWVVNSSNSGNVTALNSNFVAGIVGNLVCGGSYEIINITNSGNVSGKDYVGGIIGSLVNQVYDGTSFKMTKLTNTGNINGVERVGGICGYLYADANRSGHTLTLTATIFKNTGNVTGTTKVGGLIGEGISDITNSSISLSESKGNIAGEAYVGGLAGRLSLIRLVECSNEGSFVTASGFIDGNAYLGGYAGESYIVEGCHNAVEITYTSTGNYIGGISGYSSGWVVNSSNSGNVAAPNSNFVAGIVGNLVCGGSYEIINITNSGNVSGKDYVGGIIGSLVNQVYDGTSFKMTKLTNTGNINGVERVGGICGYLYADANRSGHTLTLTATIFKNTGNVTGTTKVGVLIGEGITDTGNSSLNGYECFGLLNGVEVTTIEQLFGVRTNINIV